VKPAAVIFDMDGVLVDSEPLHFAALRQVMADLGVDYTAAENEALLGWTTPATFAELMRRHNLPGPVERYVERYDAAILPVLSTARPAEGVVHLVQALRDGDVPLGVASGSRPNWIAATLRAIDLADAFKVVVSGDEVARGKPAPDIYLAAAERLGVSPSGCVAIEDSPNGVAAARAAGMQVVGVRTSYTAHLSLDGAAAVVDSLAHLGSAARLLGLGQEWHDSAVAS
jgi:HAD superfamily hydrolase (TIGR01509 family)